MGKRGKGKPRSPSIEPSTGREYFDVVDGSITWLIYGAASMKDAEAVHARTNKMRRVFYAHRREDI